MQRKIERRERRREEKALVAARLDTAIEKELLDRLRQGTYKDIYNFPQKAFDNALKSEEVESEVESDEEEEEEEEDEHDVGAVEYVAADDMEESDLSDLEDLGEESSSEEEEADREKIVATPAKRKRPHVEIELTNLVVESLVFHACCRGDLNRVS
ncbi:hypothetical protein V5799_030729 [Amblyomma americanum]|uniref:MAK16-like protein n=1 Tax=Amblyomma americanum TaxID=6943 RepID=A0AAQ4EMI2_AMBAM